MKMPPNTKAINLDIEIDVLTAGSTAEIVNAILEFLLYQRNQIPFVCKTFKYYVNKWLELHTPQDDEADSSVQSFQVQRQREQATRTKESISAMQDLIFTSFERNAIQQLRFLFGATTFTPKEAYTVHIPIEAIERRHSYSHHRLPHGRLNQTLLSLLTSEELYGIFSSNLCATNLYLEFEMLNDATESSNLTNANKTMNIFPKEISQLPMSCKDIHLHLLHKPVQACEDENRLQCCQDLCIFEDFHNLNITSENNTSFKKQEEASSVNSNCTPAWWEADVIVRGFKAKTTGNASFWNK